MTMYVCIVLYFYLYENLTGDNFDKWVNCGQPSFLSEDRESLLSMEGPHYRVEVQEYDCVLGGELGLFQRQSFPLVTFQNIIFLPLDFFVSFVK